MKRNSSRHGRAWRHGLGGVGLGAATALAFFLASGALADGSYSTETVPRVIPFEGELELDGVGYSGTVDLEISLYDSASGGAVAFSETHEGVSVAAGRFAVLLGSTSAAKSAQLEAAVADASELHASVRVKHHGAAASSYAALSGRQLIGPSPHTLWAPQAADMEVHRDLNVWGTTSTGGLTTRGDLHIDKDSAVLTVGDGSSGPVGFAFGDAGGQGGQLLYRLAPNQLIFENRSDFGNGTDAINIDLLSGDLVTAGSATFGGVVTVDGNVTLPAGSTMDLGGSGSFVRFGQGAPKRKGVAFRHPDSAKGAKLVYDAAERRLAIEHGSDPATNDQDVLTIDYSGRQVTAQGDVYVRGRVTTNKRPSTAGREEVEGSGDVSFDAASCTPGQVKLISTALNASDRCDSTTPNAGICVCANPDGTYRDGWHCFH